MTKQQELRQLMSKLLGKKEADKIYKLLDDLRKQEKDVTKKEEVLARELCAAMNRTVLKLMLESE